MSVAAKTARLFWRYLFRKSNILKNSEGKLFIKSLSTTLLQIVFKLFLCSEVIFESMTGLYKNRQVNLQAKMGYTPFGISQSEDTLIYIRSLYLTR